MFRILSIVITSAAILSMSGCVLGPSGGGGHCNSCDGYSAAAVGGGPGASFREWRRSLTCGAGCGETYYDEWYSTPPDCEDPCPQFAGGGGGGCGAGGCGGGACGGCGLCLNGGCSSSCGPGCGSCGGGIQPIRRIASLAVGIYGKRFCNQCGYDTGSCGCDGGSCGGEIISEGGVIHGGGGCTDGSCSINHGGGHQVVASSNLHRSPAHRQVMARQQVAQTVQPAPVARQVSGQTQQKFYRQATRLPQGQSAFRR